MLVTAAVGAPLSQYPGTTAQAVRPGHGAGWPKDAHLWNADASHCAALA